MNRPLFSIIIPVCNSAQYLSPLWSSLSTQSEESFEVFFVDDGSTDSPVFPEDRRVKIIRIPHSGRPSVARNQALAAAGGEYLLFLDADDVLLPDALQKLFNALRDNAFPQVLAAGFESGSLDKSGVFQRISRTFMFHPADGKMSGCRLLELLGKRRQKLVSNSFTAIYRTDFILAHGLRQNPELSLAEDHEWLPRVLFAAESVAATDTVYYRYIRRRGSVSTSIDLETLTSAAKAAAELAEFYVANRKKMSRNCRRFICDHAASSFIWYFFNPRYDAAASWNMRLDALRRSGILNSFALPRVFASASMLKRLAVPFLLAAYAGVWGPFRFFMRLKYAVERTE